MRAAAVLAFLALTGCFGAGDPAGPIQLPQAPDTPEPADDQVAAAGPLTLAAPVWRPGLAWTYRLTHQLQPAPVDLTVVATSVQGNAAVVGYAPDQPWPLALIAHFPPVGAVTLNPFGWMVHDRPAEIIRFPAAEGTTFAGQWSQDRLQVRAERVTFHGPLGPEETLMFRGVDEDGVRVIDAVWSAKAGNLGAVTRYFEGNATATLELLAVLPGNPSGAVVPTIHDGVVGQATPDAPPQRDSVSVSDGVTDVLLATFYGDGPGLVSWTLERPPPLEPVTMTQPTNAGQARTMVLQAFPGAPGTWALTSGVYGEAVLFRELMLVSHAPAAG